MAGGCWREGEVREESAYLYKLEERELPMLPRSQRLHAAKDFMRVYRRGRRYTAGWLAVAWFQGGESGKRIGIVVPNSAARKAVRRNLLKRRMRAVVARCMRDIPHHTDVVLTARAYPRDEAFYSLEAHISRAIRSMFQASPRFPHTRRPIR